MRPRRLRRLRARSPTPSASPSWRVPIDGRHHRSVIGGEPVDPLVRLELEQYLQARRPLALRRRDGLVDVTDIQIERLRQLLRAEIDKAISNNAVPIGR